MYNSAAITCTLISNLQSPDESVVEETLQSPSGEEERNEGDGEDTQMEGEVLQGNDAKEKEEHSQVSTRDFV